MDPADDGFWGFVEKMSDGGGFKCKFCGQPFAFTTSITRFKWHWSGVGGHGVKICDGVNAEIQKAALQALQQPSNKKRKSSSNMINEVGDLGGDLERMQLARGVQGEGRASTHAQAAGDHMENICTPGWTKPIHTSFWTERLTVDALEPRGDAQQVTDLVSQLDMERTNWQDIARIGQFMEVDVENGTGGLTEAAVAGASSSRGLPCNTSDHTREDPLPTSTVELVGKASEENKNVILSWLMNDKVSLVGIYGMAGVGKTSLVKLIYDELKKRSDTFHDVCWISVSQNCTIYELQKRIARQVFGFNLSSEDDETYRARIILYELIKNPRIIILDDLWNFYDLEKVGIPIQKRGYKQCQLIFTTRSSKVCQEMVCQCQIKVMPLSQEEAWILFKKKLMHDVVLSPKVEPIARSITKECAGLPLAIVTMARSMRGVDDLSEWRNTLKKLEDSKVRDMEDEVFCVLRLSYDRLDDSKMQKCFLYCALFPEDYEINRIELICHLIDEGIIEGMESRQAEYDEGHTMLNKLENVCLLERCRSSIDDRLAVKMHDLLRDLAVQIQCQSSQVMVEAGSTLIELPDLKDWKENLVRATLMQNQIEKVPSSLSPKCPNLSTLLLQSNKKLRFIADCFFNHFPKLKILDMSATAIEILPNSISDLVALKALVLKHCWKLWHVPSLEKLKALRRLDLGGTVLENIPQGMECLSDLRYLRLNGCGQKEFPAGILPRLSSLQVFILEEQWPPMGYIPASVKGEDLACLRKLEELQCHFEHPSDLAEYLDYSQDQIHSLSEYCLFAGKFDRRVVDIIIKRSWKKRIVGLSNFSISSRDSDFQVIHRIYNIEELWIGECHDATSLCDISSPMKYAELEVIGIWDCKSMESLLSSWLYSSPLELRSSIHRFSRLERFHCYRCISMKKLFPLALLPNLLNLVHIKVEDCPNMEEIIATGDEEVHMIEESSRSSITKFNLPKLQILELRQLPQLKSICRTKLNCKFLQQIVVWDCTKLKRMPFSFSSVLGLPSRPHFLEEISVYPKEWWEFELVWDDPGTKEVLLPFVTFAWYPLETSVD